MRIHIVLLVDHSPVLQGLLLHNFENLQQQCQTIKQMKNKSLNTVSPQEQQKLKLHALALAQREQELIEDKLRRERQKIERIKDIENNFVQWAGRKEELIKEKIEKSEKNKEEQINKIVKKCKQHEKYIQDKLKKHHIKQKSDIKCAWKKIQQVNRNIEKSEFQSTFKRRISERVKTEGELSHSLLGKRHSQANNLNKTSENFSQLVHIRLDATQEINEGIEYQEGNNNLKQKILQALKKSKQYNQDEERQKIQELGERLEKIEVTRLKKLEIIKKKRRNPDHILAESQIRELRRQAAKEVKKPLEKTNSTPKQKEKRVKDWSTYTKNKRDEYLQNHISQGNNYLEWQKVKYLKTIIAKKIAEQALEKKLYLERLLTH